MNPESEATQIMGEYISLSMDFSYVQLKVHTATLAIILFIVLMFWMVYSVKNKREANKKQNWDAIQAARDKRNKRTNDFLSDFSNRLDGKFGTTCVDNGEILEQVEPTSLSMIKEGPTHSVIAVHKDYPHDWFDISIVNAEGFQHIKDSFEEVRELITDYTIIEHLEGYIIGVQLLGGRNGFTNLSYFPSPDIVQMYTQYKHYGS